MTAALLVHMIKRVLSFDALNNVTARVRLSDYPEAERKEIEAAIDACRERLLGTAFKP